MVHVHSLKSFLGVLLVCCLPLIAIIIFLPPHSAGEQPHPLSTTDMSLREIARKKLHHGDKHFINPLNSKHNRDFSEVLRWKLFSRNKFKQFYKDEEILPVRIDWPLGF